MINFACIFLVAFSTLSFQIMLTRLFSVISWYHLAFFAISLGMLGMTAGGVFVYLHERSFLKDRFASTLSLHSLLFGFSQALLTVAFCMAPALVAEEHGSKMFALLALWLSWVPFFFSGVVTSALLTRSGTKIGRLYSTDLIGAACGCLLVLFALDWTDTPSLMILSGAVACVASLLFAIRAGNRKFQILAGVVFAAIVGLGLGNSPDGSLVHPRLVKGNLVPRQHVLFSDWNTFSRVMVLKPARELPSLNGPSPQTPQIKYLQYYMDIDGLAATTVTPMKDSHILSYDITNFAYHLKRGQRAAIIGVGGGRDMQSALNFGYQDVLGVEVNPIFIGLHHGLLRDVSGLADNDKARFVVDDARSYMARSEERFDLLQMSLIDTWAATGAGAFSLSENGLYTVEAWKVFLERLAPSGVFTVSRWYSPNNLGETGRMISLAKEALLEHGVSSPERHIVLVTTDKLATLMLSESPFTEEQKAAIRQIAKDFEFSIAIMPGEMPPNVLLEQVLVGHNRWEEIPELAGLNYSAPRDESPFFFNMLPFSGALRGVFLGHKLSPELLNEDAGVVSGNIKATKFLIVLLMSLFAVALVIVFFPLLWSDKTRELVKGLPITRASYFSLLGMGFMFVEMGLIQRLSVYLGHPVYALGIVLFTIIASTGIGSLISDGFSLERRPIFVIIPVFTVLLLLALVFVLPTIITDTARYSIAIRGLVSVLATAPVGIMLGMYFPIGMRLEERNGNGCNTPWYFALNGTFGVLTSALAVCVAIQFGITLNLLLAALMYSLTIPCLAEMRGVNVGGTIRSKDAADDDMDDVCVAANSTR